jgi:ADP-heptose:LPS heptosyltransferase
MQHLVLETNIKGVGLGDRIDYLCTANMLAEQADDDFITIYKRYTPNPTQKQEFICWDELSSLFKPRHMILEMSDNFNSNLKFLNYPRYNIGSKNDDYQNLLSSLGDFPKIKVKDYSKDLPPLPEKFITMQWDAGQQRRRCSEDEIQRIVDFYKDLGYEIIGVGGQASNPMLRNDLHKIAYIMSKADLHVGVDSGFMHLAKIVMPSNKIHIYTSNFTHQFVSTQLQNVLNAGAVLNYSRDK